MQNDMAAVLRLVGRMAAEMDGLKYKLEDVEGKVKQTDSKLDGNQKDISVKMGVLQKAIQKQDTSNQGTQREFGVKLGSLQKALQDIEEKQKQQLQLQPQLKVQLKPQTAPRESLDSGGLEDWLGLADQGSAPPPDQGSSQSPAKGAKKRDRESPTKIGAKLTMTDEEIIIAASAILGESDDFVTFLAHGPDEIRNARKSLISVGPAKRRDALVSLEGLVADGKHFTERVNGKLLDVNAKVAEINVSLATVKKEMSQGWREAAKLGEDKIAAYLTLAPVLTRLFAEVQNIIKDIISGEFGSVENRNGVGILVAQKLPSSLTVTSMPTPPPNPVVIENRIGFILTLIGVTEFKPGDLEYLVATPELANDPVAKKGWSYYAMLADEKGDLNRVAFGKLIQAIIETIYNLKVPNGFTPTTTDQASMADQLVNALLAQIKALRQPILDCITIGNATEDSMAAATKIFKNQDRQLAVSFAKNLIDKFWECSPALIDNLFRYFDVDSNGSVSRSEFIALITTIFPMPDEMPAPTIWMDRAVALFRMVDKDSSGSVEPKELCEVLVTDVFKLVVGLLKTTLTEIFGLLRAVVKDLPPLSEATLQQLPGWSESRKGVVLHDMLLNTIKGHGFVQGLLWEASRSCRSLGGAANGFALCVTFSMSFSTYIVAFEREADKDGTLSRQQVIDIISSQFAGTLQTVLPIVIQGNWRNFLKALPNEGRDGIVLDQSPFFNPLQPMKIPADVVRGVLDKLVAAFMSYVKGPGIQQFIGACVDFIDANDDGRISKSEIFGITTALMALIVSPCEETLAELGLAVIKFFDVDGSGLLTDASFKLFVIKIINFIEQVYKMVAESLEAAIVTGLPPVFDLFFYAKSLSLIGGSKDCLTLQEFYGALELSGLTMTF